MSLRVKRELEVKSLKRRGHGLAVELCGQGDVEEPEGGGGGVVGGDGGGEGGGFFDAFSPGDPGDEHVVGDVKAVGLVVASVVGGDEDDAGFGDAGFSDALPDLPEGLVGDFEGFFLLR